MKSPYPPDLLDLYYLYEIIRLNKRITILEYGSGWSTLILYKALLNLKQNIRISHILDVMILTHYLLLMISNII